MPWTSTRATTPRLSNAIADGEVGRAPAQDAVYDALALKQDIGGNDSASLVTATGSTTARTLADRFAEKYNVKDYGAVGDGSTDDTSAIQAAFTACRTAGGGEVHLTPAKTHIISQALIVGSNTTIRLNGATIKAKNPGFVGTSAANTCQLIRNYNFSASSLTDYDIYLVGPGTLDHNSVVISGGGAHGFSGRYVSRIGAENVTFKNGENGTAFLACEDAHTEECVSLDMTNCHFDHWDGSGTATVYKCHAENGVSVSGAQGIQFTGTGSAGENRTSTDCVVEACTVVGIRNAGAASGIISNAADADSTTYSFRSSMNIIEDCDLGLVFDGEGGRHFSQNDTFKGVTKVPILLKTSNSDSPDDCQVHNPLLIDCDDDGNSALIQFTGTKHIVKGVKIVNTGSVLYTRIAYFAATASDCLVEIADGSDGTTERVLNSGTNCRVIDQFRRYEEGTYTPVVSFGGGSTGITYSTQIGRYTRVGDLVFVTGYIVMTAKGSSTGNARISVPIAGAATTQPGGGVLPYTANMTGLTSPVTCGMNSGGSTLVLRDHGATGAVDVDDTNFNNNSNLTFTATYKAVS